MFKNKNKKNSANKKVKGAPQQPEGPIRVKLPREGEVLGIIDQRLGAGRISVRCIDGKTRNCRVPGRLKRRLWLREGDFVIVKQWEFDEEKGDVLFKYNPTQVSWLRNKGHLEKLEQEF